MSFAYGSDTLNIKNPFTTEGKIIFVAGVAISLIGVGLLMSVPLALKVSMATGWKDAILGLAILLWGIGTCIQGVFKVSKFYISRTAPASLARNLDATSEERCTYSNDQVESMLVSRKNLTFAEPKSVLQRVLYNFLPDLIFTPPPVYKLLIRMTQSMQKILIGAFIFAIIYFVAAVKLLGEAGLRFLPLMSFVVLAFLTSALLSTTNDQDMKQIRSAKKLLAGILFVTFGARLLTVFSRGGAAFELTFNAWPAVILCLVAVATTFGLALWFVKTRQYGKVSTEASEHRDNIQKTVHPNEVMIHLEKIILAKRRYKEIPNRIYKKFEPVLHGENVTKGSFEGSSLTETQPEYIDTDHQSSFVTARLLLTVIGQVCIVLSALLLVLSMTKLGTSGKSLSTSYTLLFTALILYGSGAFIQTLTHIFWSEIRFKSFLLLMKLDGTFTETIYNIGKSVYDTTGTTTTGVRSSITRWIMCCRMTTSTFAEAGVGPVEGARYVLDMQKDDNEAQSIIYELNEFLSNRSNVTDMNAKDLEAVSNINDINKSSGVYKSGILRVEAIQPVQQQDTNVIEITQHDEA